MDREFKTDPPLSLTVDRFKTDPTESTVGVTELSNASELRRAMFWTKPPVGDWSEVPEEVGLSERVTPAVVATSVNTPATRLAMRVGSTGGVASSAGSNELTELDACDAESVE
jgi:hypothetical protein|tara:strand:- start:13362 stop:13700 length:339 start_codon:yes stop_codon:yes gene_type:complete